MKVTIIGCGRLGAPYAAGMAELGHEVLCVDIDPPTLAALRAGRTPFTEPGLDRVIAVHATTGRLSATDSYDEAARFGDIYVLCVPTPQQVGSLAADLTDLDRAFTEVAKRLRCDSVIMVKSSVPVGTSARLAEQVPDLVPAGIRAEVVASPDFMRESNSITDVLTPSRIVLGLGPDSRFAETLLRNLWKRCIDHGTPLIVTDLATAELSKVAANAFLSTKISFINALGALCDAAGADVTALARTLAADPRITGHALNPGLGFGGSCLSKDIRALVDRARELGAGHDIQFLAEVDQINQRRRAQVVDLTRRLCGGDLRHRRVAVWGVAFKPNIDDIRDSPALDVALRVHAEGAYVNVYDPLAMDSARTEHPELRYATDAKTAVARSHVLLHLTDWDEFRDVDPVPLRPTVVSPVVIDARHTLDPDRWEAAGWTYRAPGRPRTSARNQNDRDVS